MMGTKRCRQLLTFFKRVENFICKPSVAYRVEPTIDPRQYFTCDMVEGRHKMSSFFT